MKIVVLDDEIESLLLFSSHMVDMPSISFSIFKDDYLEALHFIANNKVDIVFLDIVMPQINGIELAKQIIQIDDNIKIVFITGYTQNIDLIKKEIGKNFYGLCYKPYDPNVVKELIIKASNDNKKIFFKMFPRFDVFVNDVRIDFSRSKAKELLALLADHQGGEVTLEEAITKLWVDKNVELAKRLYRDAICRLRMTLKEYGIEYIVSFQRARTCLNINYISCDYYDYLKSKNNDYNGEYLRPYEWSVETAQYLDNLKR